MLALWTIKFKPSDIARENRDFSEFLGNNFFFLEIKKSYAYCVPLPRVKYHVVFLNDRHGVGTGLSS